MMWRLTLILSLIPSVLLADSVIMTRTVRAQTILTESDMTVVAAEILGALADPTMALGQEARVTLYAGRPVRPGDFGSPASVERNQTVVLAYQAGGLDILTEGRALERGGTGDVIRVMNVASRSTVLGQIDNSGQVQVMPNLQGMN
jgi:flagella basal body P-ring formation protein FlgA